MRSLMSVCNGERSLLVVKRVRKYAIAMTLGDSMDSITEKYNRK